VLTSEDRSELGDGAMAIPTEVKALGRRILSCLKPTPAKGRRLAVLAGTAYNSYFCSVVAELVELGLVRHTRGGYSRPTRASW
jgi:hypothetical protein